MSSTINKKEGIKDNKKQEELEKKENLNKDVFKQIMSFFPYFCTNDENRKMLIVLLNEKPTFKGISVPDELVSQENRFQFVKNIFKSRTIPKEEKEK